MGPRLALIGVSGCLGSFGVVMGVLAGFKGLRGVLRSFSSPEGFKGFSRGPKRISGDL